MSGLTRDERHRYRWNDGEWQPGVTSVIKMLDKSGPLVGWAKRLTAQAAARDVDLLAKMVKAGGTEAAAAWLKTLPDFERDAAAQLGSSVHAIAEALARQQDVQVTPEQAPFVDAYMHWVAARKPKFRNVEFMVYSERHAYGGTADAVMEIAGDLWMVDIKTSKGVYGETALQLAGYGFADWAGRPNDPKKYAIPKVVKWGVLHVRPEGAELVPFHIRQDEFLAFLACRRLLAWTQERAPIVKGVVELGEAA